MSHIITSSSIDLFPAKAQFLPGETVTLILEGDVTETVSGILELTVTHLADTAAVLRMPVSLSPARRSCPLPLGEQWETRHDAAVGYGVEALLRLEDHEGVPVEAIMLSTAFDIAAHWSLAPRYGFLSDFHPGHAGELEDVRSLLRYHLNVIQFYDWMYRHDELVPRSDIFVDPMGRTLSYEVVREKLAALHKAGMAAMAYGAVYAALADFHCEHPHWGLYKANGEPYELIQTFYIMDISPGSPWTDKIVYEFRRVIEEAGFDGIHLDQYGFPKHALTKTHPDGKTDGKVDLAQCYPQLINRIRQELEPLHPGIGLIFNNVSSYPVHATAGAEQDAVYIEVWPPFERYGDLKSLIDRGRELSHGKHVILAAYLHAFKEQSPNASIEAAENGALLVMAVIFASGGFHLALGEDDGVLTEAYYPDYRRIRPAFAAEVRSYYDFMVAYSELLVGFDLLDLSMTYTGGINSEVRFFHETAAFHPCGGADRIWTIVKRGERGLLLQFINLTGIGSDIWNEGKPNRPAVVTDIRCEVAVETGYSAVYSASPDNRSKAMTMLPYSLEDSPEHGCKITFVLPRLSVWSIVFLKI